MANLTGAAIYQDFLRRLETTDPKHPDTWNPNYQALINNDVYLKQEIDGNKDEIDAVNENLAGLKVSDPVEIKQAVTLDWLYNQDHISFELFSATYSLRDISPISGVNTVVGDDSVDIADTSSLKVGSEYVIFSGSDVETVVVAEIFTGTRFRAAQALSTAFSNAALASTNFTIAGNASAENGDVYFSKSIILGNNTDAAIIIRHNGQPSDLKLYYHDTDHAVWTEAFWEWKRDISEGVIDVEYTLPARGAFALKIVCEADAAIEIQHIVAVGAYTELAGTHHPPETPVNNFPADAATDIAETPGLSVFDYQSVVASPLWASQVRVSSTAGDYTAAVYDSGEKLPGGLSISVPMGILLNSTVYYWQFRVQDSEGAWSNWSAETSFTTAATYEYINTPNNQSPSADATDVPEQPTLNASTFDTTGFVRLSLSDGTADKWTNSTTTPGEYYFSAAGGPVNKPMEVYANGAALSEGTLGSLSDGQWAWGDQDAIGGSRIYVKLAIGDPDAQAADFMQCGESHAASQWEIRSATGDYTTPVYDSGAVTDLESHVVPAGYLEEGETDYYFRVRYQGENIGWSDWSSETHFTTKAVFANIIGIALVASGGGAGVWQRVDESGNNKAADAAFFNNHPVYNNIADVTIDGQAMVKIPKFYVKVDNAPVGSDQAGKKCWWISDLPTTGFSLHPAFMDAGVEIDQFYVGKYEATDDGGTKAGSISGVAPLVSIDFPTMQSRCTARNTGGVEGFHLWHIHELSAIQILCLIENGGPDVQSTIGAGNTSSSAAVNTGTTNAVWHGIYELWGNVYHMTDGIKTNTSNQVQIFDQDGNGTWVDTGLVVPVTGYPVSMKEAEGTGYDLKISFIPDSVDSSAGNGSYADCFYSTSAGSEYVCYHGGDWDDGAHAGLFYLILVDVASASGPNIGGRLAKC